MLLLIEKEFYGKDLQRDIYSILPTRFCSVAEEAQMQILMGKQNCAG